MPVSGEAAPVRRGGASKRPGTSSANRWIAALARGGAAAAIACAVAGTTIAAAGHVLALAIDVRSETRSLVGLARTSAGLAWFAEPDTTMIPQILAAESSGAPEGWRFVLQAASGSLSDDDPIFTGSIGGIAGGNPGAEPAPPNVRIETSLRVDNPPPRPLPRARPQLASLTPADLPIRLDEDAQTAKTAIYDITARIVYMPNGDKLEAHSGFGEYMDNPKHVRLRMRGVTPPNTYKLTMREALFHGHEAIRMNPENREAMFGRAGILVHPYLLGPNGQSNGCVSVKDYPKFLAAFKRGEVERMVVVARLEKPPAFAAKRSFWPKLF